MISLCDLCDTFSWGIEIAVESRDGDQVQRRVQPIGVRGGLCQPQACDRERKREHPGSLTRRGPIATDRQKREVRHDRVELPHPPIIGRVSDHGAHGDTQKHVVIEGVLHVKGMHHDARE